MLNKIKNKKIYVALIIVLVLVTNLFTYLFFTKYYLINSFKNPFPFIDPARSIVEQEHFFTSIEPLRQDLKEISEDYQKQGVKMGIYFEYLNTGANISINQDDRFWPASLSKLPTAFAVLKKVEDDEWKLSNELVLFEEDKDDRFGDLYKLPVGTRFTIEELVKELIINSDNTAHRILVRNLSSDNYTDMLNALGLSELFDKDYNITAKEYSRLFRSLYNASYLNREYSQLLLTWMSETKFDDFLHEGVPDGVVFSHKIGEEQQENVYADSGIVYISHRPYLITVMAQSDNENARELIKKLMKEVSMSSYNYVENKK